MNFIIRIFCAIMLIADSKPTALQKFQYFINAILTFAPIVYILNGLNSWFQNNHQFFTFIIILLFLNVIIGGVYHKKMKSFDWEQFFIRNITMWLILICVYVILEFIHITAGNNYVADGFGILIQITTIMYPASKILKNCYILSNKQFPPKFIMERIYNFEKTGNLKDLLENETN